MEAELTRRRFLQAAAGVAAGVALSGSVLSAGAEAPPAIPVPSTLAGTATILKGIIQEYARLEDDPWILMHAIRAFGRDVSVKGERGVDLLCSRFLKEKTVAGKPCLYMPADLEGHTNAFLKTILEAGVPASHPFQLGGTRRTVGDLIESAKRLFRFERKSINRDDIAWTLIAFSLSVPSARDAWTNAYGEEVRLSDVIRFGFDTLDDTTRQFRSAMERGVMPEANDKIVDFTCGGTHLVYGLASCVGNGYRGDDFHKRLKAHLDLLVWRLEADGHLIERFYRQVLPPPGNPPGWEKTHALYHEDARIKFFGHSLEILTYARYRKLFTQAPAQAVAIDAAGATLAKSVRAIKGVDLFEVRKSNRRLFHLLVGDCCHAYHGIHMVPGVNEV